MSILVTKGIKVEAHPTYQADLSNPLHHKYVFTYQITIRNNSNYAVQLLHRKWFIFDSAGIKKEVEGEGVVGQQPYLEPGQEFSYESWCPLISEMGYMKGHFVMHRAVDEQEIEVGIPQFDLIAHYVMN